MQIKLTQQERQTLEDLLDTVIESALSASDAVDQALLFVEASNLRIEAIGNGKVAS